MSRHRFGACAEWNHCTDCDACAEDTVLYVVSADLGRGAFLAVLCSTCWHRRKYRAELERRLAERRA